MIAKLRQSPKEKFNGKSLIHWEKQAKRLVIYCLLSSAELDTRSIIGSLARKRLLELAQAEDSKIVAELYPTLLSFMPFERVPTCRKRKRT